MKKSLRSIIKGKKETKDESSYLDENQEVEDSIKYLYEKNEKIKLETKNILMKPLEHNMYNPSNESRLRFLEKENLDLQKKLNEKEEKIKELQNLLIHISKTISSLNEYEESENYLNLFNF